MVVPTARRTERLEKLSAAIRERGRRRVPRRASTWPSPASVERLKDVVLGRLRAVRRPGEQRRHPRRRPVRGAVAGADRAASCAPTSWACCTGRRRSCPRCCEQGRGHVVNVASLAGRFARARARASTRRRSTRWSRSARRCTTRRRPGRAVHHGQPGAGRDGAVPAPRRDRGGGLRPRSVMPPERIAKTIVRVVERGIAPEISRAAGAGRAAGAAAC